MASDTLEDFYPSKWLKASDLGGPTVTTITAAGPQAVKNRDGKTEDKPVVYLDGLKELILNRTNFETLLDISGGEGLKDFEGTKVELYTVETSMGEGIRIREPGGKKGSKKN